MKKLFALFTILIFAFVFTTAAIADEPPGDNDKGKHYGRSDYPRGNAYGWEENDGPGDNDHGGAIGFGKFKAGSFAASGAIDGDLLVIPFAATGGISGAGGVAGSAGHGFIVNGKGGVDTYARAGGLTDTDSYIFQTGHDLSIGVGTQSSSLAVTEASNKVGVKGMFGAAEGGMFGIAAQGSLVGSGLTTNPWFMDSKGVTYGVSGQGSIGGFYGDNDAFVFFGKAKAETEAGIRMEGWNKAESYRFVEFDGPAKTEGMGSIVGSETNIESFGNARDRDCGLCAHADADLRGGYIAVGGAKTMTIQSGPGIAVAGAKGGYIGAGTLGTNFEGAAHGYSGTSITTVQGYKGSINSASAGMKVTAQGGYNAD